MTAARTIQEPAARARLYASWSTVEPALRRCVFLTPPARLVLRELLEIDSLTGQPDGTGWPSLLLNLGMIDASQPAPAVREALGELERFRLLTVETNPGDAVLDLRLTLRFSAIEAVLQDPLRGIRPLRVFSKQTRPNLAKTYPDFSEQAKKSRAIGRRASAA
ncbi:MAG TPA: hypothetical protein VE987_13030 [Polyangiaceae bacterium]|nr:hypothetical protein [Polyangiaceae bacterium]